MIRADDAPAGSTSYARWAEHANEGFDLDMDLCRKGISAGDGLEYVAHLTTGTWDFSVHNPSRDLAPETFDRAARDLYLVFQRLEEATLALHSGTLIRVVLHGNRSALFHDVKVTGQNFFAVTMDGSRENVERADRRLEQITDEAARQSGSPTLNLGAYQKRSTRDQWIAKGDGGITPAEHLAHPVPAAEPRPVPQQVMSHCRRKLDLADVHFVAVYHNDRLAWQADLFDAPGLKQLFTGVTPRIRRLGYDQIVRQIAMDGRRITRLLNSVRSDRLTRLVVDVARGAIYVLPFGDGEHCLVGVTLVQSQVQQADWKMMRLYDEIASWYPETGPQGNVPG